MVRNNVGPGKKVGIVGIGGLGREYFRGGDEEENLRAYLSFCPSLSSFADIALQFAKALGADVYAFTHSLKKKDDILAMGAE